MMAEAKAAAMIVVAAPAEGLQDLVTSLKAWP